MLIVSVLCVLEKMCLYMYLYLCLCSSLSQKRHVSNDHVQIVWNESRNEYKVPRVLITAS